MYNHPYFAGKISCEESRRRGIMLLELQYNVVSMFLFKFIQENGL